VQRPAIAIFSPEKMKTRRPSKSLFSFSRQKVVPAKDKVIKASYEATSQSVLIAIRIMVDCRRVQDSDPRDFPVERILKYANSKTKKPSSLDCWPGAYLKA
jgi:hypothetical protein